MFSWFHSRRGETRAKRQAVKVDEQSSRERRREKLNGLRESIHRLEKLITRSFRENELGGHRYRACAREAMVQGESIADRILMLELATDTHRESSRERRTRSAARASGESLACDRDRWSGCADERDITHGDDARARNDGGKGEPLHGDKIATRKAVEKRRCSSVINSGVFDRRRTGSVCLTAGHEHEQKRAERFAEQRTEFRKTMNANPEPASRVAPRRLPDGRFKIAIHEQVGRELDTILRTI